MKALASLLVLVAFATSACGEPADSIDEDKTDDTTKVVTKTLNNGKTVECVVFRYEYAGGIWCIPTDSE